MARPFPPVVSVEPGVSFSCNDTKRGAVSGCATKTEPVLSISVHCPSWACAPPTPAAKKARATTSEITARMGVSLLLS